MDMVRLRTVLGQCEGSFLSVLSAQKLKTLVKLTEMHSDTLATPESPYSYRWLMHSNEKGF